MRRRAITALFGVALLVGITALPVEAATTHPDTWSSEYAGTGNASTNEGEKSISATTASRLKLAWQDTEGSTFVAPSIVNGVVYRAVNSSGFGAHGSLVAQSVKTGKKLWSTKLVVNAQYDRGQTVVGNLILLPYEGWQAPAGITAINLTTHKVAWNRPRPASTGPNDDTWTGGPISVDAGRVYLNSSGASLSAYDVTTGALLWHVTEDGYAQGMTAGNGMVYTAGQPGGSYYPGLIAYDGATGKVKWKSPNLFGIPVVVGNRLLVPSYQGVVGLAATGCGHTTCKPLWSLPIAGSEPGQILIGGADTSTAFVGATIDSRHSVLKRFDVNTGAAQWTATLSAPLGYVPIRVANTVWLIVGGTTIMAWSVAATKNAPLKTIAELENMQGSVQGLAAANGSLIVDSWFSAVTAYRIPGA